MCISGIFPVLYSLVLFHINIVNLIEVLFGLALNRLIIKCIIKTEFIFFQMLFLVFPPFCNLNMFSKCLVLSLFSVRLLKRQV